ncbi:MAG: O-methyltransferase [Phycisphaerales bacterium]|nr:O-methyltransferase [Phycisphaerales bacterium]
MEMTAERWQSTIDYLNAVFGTPDPDLAAQPDAAASAGLPPIAVSSEVGRLLALLVAGTRGRRALEVGTLGGFSGTWIARALAPRGHLTTIERDPAHAAFARDHFRRLGLADRVTVREGIAADVLAALRAEWAPGSVDVVFLDADKTSYPLYWTLTRELIAPGGLLIADNCLGSNAWWIDDVGHPDRDGADALNRAVAADDDFVSTLVPLRQGVLIARRRPDPE